MMPYSMKFAKKTKQKKKTKIKIKFQKMKGNFLDSIPRLKSHQPPPKNIYRKLYREISLINESKFKHPIKLTIFELMFEYENHTLARFLNEDLYIFD